MNSHASILMVDDRPANLVALEAILTPLGCTLVSAESGEAALKLILARDFAAILLDARMPGLDGYETAGCDPLRRQHRDVTSARASRRVARVMTSRHRAQGLALANSPR